MRPVRLGLDLKGGVQFKFEVDLDAIARAEIEDLSQDLRRALRDAGVRGNVETRDGAIVLRVPESADAAAVRPVIAGLRGAGPVRELTWSERRDGDVHEFALEPHDEAAAARQESVMRQNVLTLRNRVDELGLSEPVVARLGQRRILVQIPGARDPAQVRRILTATASVQWHLENTEADARRIAQSGDVPPGSILRPDTDARPVLLHRDVIASGDELDNATFMYVEGKPIVSIELDRAGARRMLETTQRNVGRPLAVLLVEESREPAAPNAESRTRREETVIFVGRIANVFSSTFRLSGLSPVEAQDLAILLRSGALAAPIYEVGYGTVGPSLGQDNIRRGRAALVVGFVAVVVFMGAYYRSFGWIANLALLANLVLIVGVLSVLPAALTLPGIAGIVLTVGMAVDANVLIFERIRESLRNGNSLRASIDEGYRRAFATIADANVTTLIAALALFAFGTGPIQGFAVTLGIGVVTSMFTAVVGTRVIVDLLYYGKRPRAASDG